MNPAIQSGTHPDAENLTAFAEQSLTGAEREQILAHMAVCGRCREVVFLAQQAIDAPQTPQVLVEQRLSKTTPRSWFAGWRWAWAPVAALAGFVGIAAVLHMRHVAAPEYKVARNAPQAEMINGPLAANSANLPVKQNTQKQEQTARLSSSQRDGKFATALAEKKATRQKDEMEGSAPSRKEAAGDSAGLVSGLAVARAKSSSPGGPMAQNQMQQQNALQNAMVLPQSPANEISNKPLSSEARSPAAQPGAATETVEVTPVQPPIPAPQAPKPMPRIATVPVIGQNLGIAKDKMAKSPTGKMGLPSGLEVMSQATAGGRSIALDAAGTLFLSEDAGKHWQPVKAQWTGQAVLVRSRQTGSESAAL